MSGIVSYFGPEQGIDSKDYLFMMQGASVISPLVSLLGHTLTEPNVELSDALQVTRVELRNGRIVTIVKTKRAPEVRSRSYTVGFPAGALWTPAMHAALRPGGCRNTFYMKYLCSQDERYSHVEIFPEGLLDAPQEEGDLITVDEENIISSTSTLNVSEKLRLWNIGYEKIYTDGGGDPYYAVAFATDDCPTCADVPGLGMFAGGGDGTAAAVAQRTDDRFSNVTAMTTGVAAGSVVKAIYTEGSVVVVGAADDGVIGTALTGSLHVSGDGGASFQTVASITTPVNGLAGFGGVILAVGGETTGGAEAWLSTDRGTSWTALTSTAFPAADAFAGVAFDRETMKFYVVGESGTLLSGLLSGTTITFTDISANLPGAPGTLQAVNVFNDNHLAVGGAAGYYAESLDGGVTWTEPPVPGSSAITSIAGNDHRAVVGAGTALYERSSFNDFTYTPVTLLNGQTISGTVNAVSMGVEGDFNMFVAVTSAAEVILAKPFYPNA